MIEVVMVIAIIGVLFAVVSVGMLGLSAEAQQRADDEEMMTIQSAMNFMLMDQGVDPADACAHAPGDSGGVFDMKQFPSSEEFRTSAGEGGPASRRPVQLYPHYLRQQYMRRAYVCANGGTVRPADDRGRPGGA